MSAHVSISRRPSGLGSMLAVDFRRLFTQRLFLIMLGVSIGIPVLMLVMTSAFSGGGAGMFATPWQAIGSMGGSGGLDVTAMCNINLLYFGAAVFVAMFVSDDFRSGYAKNLFASRACVRDYVVSKLVVCAAACGLMLVAFLAGSVVGGAIGGLPLALGELTVANLVFCMLCKVLLMAAFVAIYVTLNVLLKQKMIVSMGASIVVGVLMFMTIPSLTPLDAGVQNVVVCLVGGAVLSVVAIFAGSLILGKRDIL